ncbi:YggN family protein [Xanthomonas campestris pv. asclepiadis]|uniref:DUF2884 family protein n=1 Tax=Xanthomonas campestris TaxID=339 RepID=UPI001E3C45D6|nr:DUF2884 family protein [Xanthomonas campestris]MCC4615135.1 YggN family protein [Xanthomonas campestris pv. asclepiadis]
MRLPTVLAPLLLLAACSAQAATARPQVSAEQCEVSTSYDVLADSGGIWLRRKQGVPREIFFHGGELNIDRQPQPVSAADAQRLRDLEQGARALMPAVTAIARSVVDISFDALAGVVQMLTDSTRQERKVERLRGTALAQVDATLGRGRWEQALFDERFQASVERAADDLAGSLTRSVMWTVMTGRATQLERRGEQLDARMEQQMQARSQALEAQAQTLCTQAQALYGLQQALEYRFQGERLQMLELNTRQHKDEKDQSDAPVSNGVVVTAAH